MTQFVSITPKQALAVIEAAGVEKPALLIRDRAAAGLVRSYADMQMTVDARGARTCLRDAALSAEVWDRMIKDGVDGDIWNGGTARLEGSDLIGGMPALQVTGVTFHPGDIARLADRERAGVAPPPSKRPAKMQSAVVLDCPDSPTPPTTVEKRRSPDLSALHSGALLLTVRQVEAAIARGRTTIHKLINEGKLERPVGDTRITAASVRRCVGLDG